jgi:hypothetical protein
MQTSETRLAIQDQANLEHPCSMSAFNNTRMGTPPLRRSRRSALEKLLSRVRLR